MDVLDVLGVGFGPSNIALAIALEESGDFESWHFLEQALTPIWQSEMLFEISLDTYSNIQNIPYRDLVSPRNPRSKYSFLNYLVENGLMFQHLNMDMLMPLRPDYARYIQWVAEAFSDRVTCGQRVESITPDDEGDHYIVRTTEGQQFRARHVVIGTGRSPYVPEQFREVANGRVLHQSRYQSAGAPLLSSLPQGARVAVIGSSQSAGEILLHLSKTYPHLMIDSIMRRYAFPLKDTSPFMSEAFFPEFTEMYYRSSDEVRRRIDVDIARTNYGAADMDVLEELYRQMYYDKLHGKEQIRLLRLTDVQSVVEDGESVVIELHDIGRDEMLLHRYDAVVLATGFSNIGPGSQDTASIPLLESLRPWLASNSGPSHVKVDRGYAVEFAHQPVTTSGTVILNGLCERSHGIGDGGSLSLTAIRSADILSRIRETSNVGAASGTS